MKIIILGAGLVGVTTAYVLAERGHQVVMLERNAGPAEETSFANGGQLSYSDAKPWAAPSTAIKLPKWVCGNDSPLVIRPRADIRMMTWGMRFLYHCNTASSRRNCIDLLRLGLYSKEKMQVIRESSKIEFDFSDQGILHMFTRQSEFEEAQKHVQFQKHYGCDQRILDADETLRIEPSLAHTDREVVGSIHAYLDEIGDPLLYCQALCQHMQKHMGVEILYNTTIDDLQRHNDKSIDGVQTSQGVLTADAYVSCLGVETPFLLDKHAVRVPIYPMKGYSFTVEANEFSTQRSIMDTRHKIVYTRLGSKVRVAGTAELAGYNTDVDERQIAPILDKARRLFPKMDWESGRTEWACIRPSTPDGPPRIGKTKYHNLFLNTGHGTLGWTQCAGSAYILADIMEGRPPEISSNGPMVRV